MGDSFHQQEKSWERTQTATENFYQDQIQIDHHKKIFNRIKTQPNLNSEVEVRKNKKLKDKRSNNNKRKSNRFKRGTKF